MKSSILVTIVVTLLPLSLIAGEPSAFGAGDLNSPNPYGLTPSEEVILQNKKNLNRVVVKSNNQANEVDSIRDRIDGLQGIIESLARKSQKNKTAIKKLLLENSEELKSNDEFEKRLSDITQKNLDDIESIRTTISDMSTLLNNINSKYVTKEEFNTLIKDVNRVKGLLSKDLKSSSSSKGSALDKMKKADIAQKARRFYDKKLYTKSIEYYKYLAENNYRPARAHYMIGEMMYYRKNYADAIAYFKKSASLYDKATYMPVLMLHTAVSMTKTGDKKNAKVFYQAIISKYPDTKYAKDSQKYLSSMK